MSFKCGIVGLPNVGKSTLFNALTKSGISAENFPFCTIEPNTGIVPVPDKRLIKLSNLINPERTVPTTIEFVDIAGLVAGASKGEGLGNKFLANIRETDAIVHVVRCFDDSNIIHVSNHVNPQKDIETIDIELIYSDLESCEKRLLKINKLAKGGDKNAKFDSILIQKLIDCLSQEKTIISIMPNLSNEENNKIKSFQLLTSKPVMYIANVDESGFNNNKYLDIVKNHAEKEKAIVVAVCNKIEAEIAEFDDNEEAKIFLESLGLEEPGLNRVIRAGYQLLDLETYFTAGKKEVRAWTIQKNSTAPKAASVIHTDFERGFIRAEVISYNDFIEYNGEQGAKEAGKWRLEGKEYVVKEADIIHFRFNV